MNATSISSLTHRLQFALGALIWMVTFASQAGITDGTMRMEVITAYKVVVDSNVECPTTRRHTKHSISASYLGTIPLNFTGEFKEHSHALTMSRCSASSHCSRSQSRSDPCQPSTQPFVQLITLTAP